MVHFCKNIILPKDISFRGLLSELSRVDLGKAYETSVDTRLRDKNKNEVLHLRCGTREWCVYNKIEDLQKTRNKREDKSVTILEKEIMNIYDLEKTEIFRYEYRLNQAATIKSEINTILGREYQKPVLLQDLFIRGLWKKVLLASWRKIANDPGNQLAFLPSDKKLDLLLHIFKKAGESDKSAHSQNKALISYGLASASIDCGVKVLRKESAKIWSTKAGDRMSDKLDMAASLVEGLPISQNIYYISKELELFNPVNLDSLPKKHIV